MPQLEFDAWIAQVFGIDPARYSEPSGGGSAAQLDAEAWAHPAGG